MNPRTGEEKKLKIKDTNKGARPRIMWIKFTLHPSNLSKSRIKKSDAYIEAYKENYWLWIGNMITTLPNAFTASFDYDSTQDTLARSLIRQPKPRVRELTIAWSNKMSINSLGSEEEFETMRAYSYKKLLEWAEELPDIHEIMSKYEEDK